MLRSPARSVRRVLLASAASIAVLSAALPASAQTAPPAGQPGQAQGQGNRPRGQAQTGALQRVMQAYAELVQSLELTPEQQETATALRQEAMTQMRELQSLPQGERREKFQTLMRDMSSKLMQELNDDQKVKFQEGLLRIAELARGGAAAPTTAPSTRPGTQAPGGAGQGLTRQLQTVLAAVSALDLTAEQKGLVDEAIADARGKLNAIEPGDPTTREQSAEIMGGLRQRLAEILTPEQRETLTERMRNGRNNGGNNAGGDRRGNRGNAAPTPPAATPTPPAATPAPGTGGEMGTGGERMTDDPMSSSAPKEKAAPADAPAAEPRGQATPNAGATPLAEVGQAAPELDVKKLDGNAVRLSSYKGRPLLLVFGSYSAPTFREKAAQLADLAGDFKGRVEVLVVYTAEAYPVGQWEIERNKDEKVRVEAHASEAARIKAARDARTTLKLEGLTFVVDAMSDKTAKAFEGTPNAAVLIGRDGVVVARQKWFEAFAMRRAVEESLSVSRTGAR